MKKLFFCLFILCSWASSAQAEKCTRVPQQVLIENRVVNGEAVACKDKDDRQWHVKTFKDAGGNDLPVPSQIFYPQPFVTRTTPQTAFTASKTITDMPLPHLTFYEQ